MDEEDRRYFKQQVYIYIYIDISKYIWCIPAEPNPLSGRYLKIFFLTPTSALYYRMFQTKFPISNYFFTTPHQSEIFLILTS